MSSGYFFNINTIWYLKSKTSNGKVGVNFVNLVNGFI